jgi:hypothetical protein
MQKREDQRATLQGDLPSCQEIASVAGAHRKRRNIAESYVPLYLALSGSAGWVNGWVQS